MNMKLDMWDRASIIAHSYLANLKYTGVRSGWDVCDSIAAHVSVSRIKKLAQCDENFLRSYVFDKPRGMTGAPAAFGVMMHDSFERMMHWICENKVQGIVPIEVAHEFFRTAWKESEVTDPIYYNEGSRIIDSYYNRYPDVDFKDIIGIEVEFNIVIEGIMVLGFMDRVDRVGDDIHIIDYKTNSQLYLGDELAVDIQASIYTIAARQLWPWAKRIIFHFEMLRHELRQTVERTQTQLELAASYLVDMTRRSEMRRFDWQAKPSSLCAYCDHFSECDTAQTAIREGTEIIPVDNDDMLQVAQERERLKKVMAPIKAQLEKLDRIIKAQLGESNRAIVYGEYKYRMITVMRRTFDGRAVAQALGQHGLDPKEVYRRIMKPDKKEVDAVVKELKAKMKGKGANARKAMLVADVEACAEEEVAFQKLDSRVAEHVLAPSQVAPQLAGEKIKCDFCEAEPAKLVERRGHRFAVCAEHKRKQKPPPHILEAAEGGSHSS